MGYSSNYRYSEIAGANAVSLTESYVVVDLSYKQAGARGVLLSEAPLKESPSTITVSVGGTSYTEVDIALGMPSGTNFAIEYSSNSGVIFLPTATALGTAVNVTYKGLGTVASIESKRYMLNGTVSAPGVSWVNETGSGRYRIGSNQFGESVNGTKVSEINTLGLLNGNIGSEFRNSLQKVYNITNTANAVAATTNYVLTNQVSFTLKSSQSKIFVYGKISVSNTSAPASSSFVNSVANINTATNGAIYTTQAGVPSGLLSDYQQLMFFQTTISYQYISGNYYFVIDASTLTPGNTYYVGVWSKSNVSIANTYNFATGTQQSSIQIVEELV